MTFRTRTVWLASLRCYGCPPSDFRRSCYLFHYLSRAPPSSPAIAAPISNALSLLDALIVIGAVGVIPGSRNKACV